MAEQTYAERRPNLGGAPRDRTIYGTAVIAYGWHRLVCAVLGHDWEIKRIVCTRCGDYGEEVARRAHS